MTKACLAIVNLLLSSVAVVALAQEHKSCVGEECEAVAAMLPVDEEAAGLEMLQVHSSKKPSSSAEEKKKTGHQKHSATRESSSIAKLVEAKDNKSSSTVNVTDAKEKSKDSDDQSPKKGKICLVQPPEEWMKDEFPKGAYWEKGWARKAQQCAQRCTDNYDCNSWTFKKEQGKLRGECFLKEYGPDVGTIDDQSAVGFVSGYKCKGQKKKVAKL